MTEACLLKLADILEGYAEDGIIRDLRQEISYGEYGLGLENLCERLFESDARLPKAVIADIADIADIAGLMRLPAERWNFVEALEEWPEDARE